MWERLPEVLRMAFREMWNGRPGPVHVEVPAPLMYQTGDDAKVRLLPPEKYRAGGPQASGEQIDEAVKIISAAQRPLIIAGAGVDRSDANAALIGIVDTLNCSLIGTMAGRSSEPIDHPNFLNPYSTGADLALRESDVVLAAGTRLGNLDTPYDKYWGDPAHQALIQIDIDQRNVGVTRPVTLAIISDLKVALENLVTALQSNRVQPKGGADLARYRDATREWREKQTASVGAWKGPGIHPAHAMQAVGAVWGRDSIYVTDGGNTSLWANLLLPPTRPRSYLNILELGMLGTGIPSAIGAKLGSPHREVVCATGDGAAGFNFMEMQSAAREKLKVTTIVFAEGSWTMEEPNERMLYGRTFGTEMGTVRWDRVGEGLGCKGWYVDRLEDLEPALKSAIATEGPSVVCIKTSREANSAIPMELLLRFVEVYQGPMGQ
jgi:acetolactate synthase-1/2/3 large subunit